MLDDHWLKPIAAVTEDFHRKTLPTVRCQRHASPPDVTSPWRAVDDEGEVLDVLVQAGATRMQRYA